MSKAGLVIRRDLIGVFVASLACMFPGSLVQGAPIAGEGGCFDLVEQWSITDNPNGPWAYRAGDLLLTQTGSPNVPGNSWRPPEGQTIPHMSIRPGPADGFDFQEGDLIIHSTDQANGPGLGPSNITWTAPYAARVDITGQIWQARDIGRGNDWSLKLNGETITSGSLFDGDPYSRANPFELKEGSGGPAALEKVPVAAGDVIELEVIQAPSSAFGEYFGIRWKICATPLLPPCPGPIAWWRADGDTLDSVGENHGALVNGAGFAEGRTLQAFNFTGGNAFVEVPESPELDIESGGAVTIATWAYRTQGGFQHVVGKRSGCGPTPFYQLAIVPEGIPDEAAPLNRWVFLAVTYGKFERHFLNTVLVDENLGSGVGANDAPLRIGGSGDCAPFVGRLDDVQIYDRELTVDEITALAKGVQPCTPFSFDRADCNGDGTVDISDPICVLGWLFLGDREPTCLAATNVNADATVDLSDSVYLLSFLFLGGPAPEAPFGICGVSSDTDLRLGCATPPPKCR